MRSCIRRPIDVENVTSYARRARSPSRGGHWPSAAMWRGGQLVLSVDQHALTSSYRTRGLTEFACAYGKP